jgi:hypothetical protein
VRGPKRHLPEAGELRDIYLLSVVTAALIRGALLHALRPAAAHLTVKPSRGGLLVKVSLYHVQQHCSVSDVILVMCEKPNMRV